MEQGAAGRPVRGEGLWQTFSWSAQRLSDRPSLIEMVSWSMGVVLVLFFVGCAIASAFSEYGPAGAAVCAALAVPFAWLTLAGPMQYRHRARLRNRLRERGVRAKGVVTDMWVMAGGSGIASMLRYTVRTQDGETRPYAAYDLTPTVWRWTVGDSIEVLYDPDRPRLAIVDDN